jgi:hypothetical protein
LPRKAAGVSFDSLAIALSARFVVGRYRLQSGLKVLVRRAELETLPEELVEIEVSSSESRRSYVGDSRLDETIRSLYSTSLEVANATIRSADARAEY